MIRLKIDVIQALKQKGYNTNRLRQEKLLGESAIQQIRNGQTPGIVSLEKICKLLGKQPGQLLEYVPDQENQEQPTTE